MPERKKLAAPEDKSTTETEPVRKNKNKAVTEANSQKDKKIDKGIIHQFMPYILFIIALFLTACYIFSGFDGAMGSVGKALRNFFCGLFGWPAFILPVIIVNLAIYWKTYVDRDMIIWKIAIGFFFIMTVSAVVHSFFITASLKATATEEYPVKEWAASVFGTGDAISNWTHGLSLAGGGFFGGLLGGIIRSFCGSIGSPILLIGLSGLSAMFYFSVTPAYVFGKIKEFAKTASEKAAVKREKRLAKQEKEAKIREEREERERERRERIQAEKDRLDLERIAKEEQKRKELEEQELKRIAAENAAKAQEPTVLNETFTFGNNNTDNNNPQTTPAAPVAPAAAEDAAEAEKRISAAQIMDEVFGRKSKGAAKAENTQTAAKAVPDIQLGTIEREAEAEPEDEGTSLSDAMDASASQLQAYMFPPVELLDPADPVSDENVTAELKENARKIMEKLQAFNVQIKKIDCSRGPTITRYELYPEATTTVRSISSHDLDISLELGTTIRIESPILGKNAVGIEVPNKVRSTVSLREMIDSDSFRNAKGTVPACIGKDVGGNLQFMDISKLPHIIIAGTTGSGKSVCINTILLSLLYRFRPNELKFIMIDPKKVELSMYNGLPHMKVPVVTNVKRAAGTLNAAANEMDARYALFEENNVRNIDSYNQLMAQNDPNFVPMPRIIIIIDELADLMMTAPAEIEDSIIRLGQMARAAGIHLIVGTQRPAADVVTKRISSNLPSRIAFSVVSYVESKIIINMTGAEKLIGKGDMLYVPTGATKPMRIQGAFVSDEEIRNVTDFIKKNSPSVVYDDKFIASIDSETERLEGEDKHSDREDDGDITEFVQDADPMFNKALHIAVENKTIATSLLQRKLSLGFGRAAKIIDRMEALQFISGANGTKPRNVLITEERLRELEAAGDVRTQGRFT